MGENYLVPVQDYKWGVAVPPNAFPPMFLTSQQRADVCCCGRHRSFWL